MGLVAGDVTRNPLTECSCAVSTRALADSPPPGFDLSPQAGRGDPGRGMLYALQLPIQFSNSQRRCRRHHKFLPSITVTVTASRSKSSSSRELTPTRGFSESGLPVDQSCDSEYVPQP